MNRKKGEFFVEILTILDLRNILCAVHQIADNLSESETSHWQQTWLVSTGVDIDLGDDDKDDDADDDHGDDDEDDDADDDHGDDESFLAEELAENSNVQDAFVIAVEQQAR